MIEQIHGHIKMKTRAPTVRKCAKQTWKNRTSTKLQWVIARSLLIFKLRNPYTVASMLFN